MRTGKGIDCVRDEKRIQQFCNRLASAWISAPDLRFGQFMTEIFGGLSALGRDPFYLEEKEMIETVESFFKEVVYINDSCG